MHQLGTPGFLCSAATCLVQGSKGMQDPCRVQVCNAGADQTAHPHTSQQVAFMQPGAHQREHALVLSFKWGRWHCVVMARCRGARLSVLWCRTSPALLPNGLPQHG